MIKSELLALPDMYNRIEQDKLRVHNMRARLYSPKGLDTRDKVQSSGGNNMLAETVIDMQQKLDKRINDFDIMRAEADKLIAGKLADNTALVMRLRYVDCFNWSEISAILDYSPATLYRYRRTALKILFK